jgi:hypothetical protein
MASCFLTAQDIGIAAADAGTARLPTVTVAAASTAITILLSLVMMSLQFRRLEVGFGLVPAIRFLLVLTAATEESEHANWVGH